MAFSFNGRLGRQLLPDLLRDIAFKQLNGVLRLSRDKISKTIAFESGEPINAFSSIPSEQLDTVLIRDGRTTEGLVSAATRGRPDPTMMGVTLVEKGIVSADVMKKAASELAARIALSMFEWTDAEYRFEETEQFCPRVLLASTAELIIEGTRQAAANVSLVDRIAPSDLWVVRRQTAGDHLAASANLNSTEGYVFAMTDSPTRLSEIATLSGLPIEQIRRAVCVLLALGMLSPVDETGDWQPTLIERSYDEVIEGISRKLRLFETANYYEILEVGRLSTITAINKAFHQLEAMFQSYRADYADSADVQHQLDELFGKIKTAHQTLGNPLKRREYDRPLGAAATNVRGNADPQSGPGGDNGRVAQLPARPAPHRPVPIPVTIPSAAPPKPSIPEPIIERGQASVSPRNGIQLPPRKPIAIPEIKMQAAPKNNGRAGIERGKKNGGSPLPTPSRPTLPQTRPPAVLSPEETARLQTAVNKDEQALHFYRQGRMRFERRELEAAAHLFREAVRLDPTQSHYHFHLAMVLSIQARARHEHLHHEGCHVTCQLGGALVSNPKVRYEAEQHFLHASQIDPANSQIVLKLGQLYKEVGLLKEGGALFEASGAARFEE